MLRRALLNVRDKVAHVIDLFPREILAAKVTSCGCIQYVLDSLKDNPPHIRNIKKYLLAALYNAPLTIENYYAAQIDYDLCGGKR